MLQRAATQERSRGVWKYVSIKSSLARRRWKRKAYCVRLCDGWKIGRIAAPGFLWSEWVIPPNASLKCQVECACFVFFFAGKWFFSEGHSLDWVVNFKAVLRKCPDCFDLSRIATAAEQRNRKFPILIHAPWESPIFPSSLDQFQCNSRRRQPPRFREYEKQTPMVPSSEGGAFHEKAQEPKSSPLRLWLIY